MVGFIDSFLYSHSQLHSIITAQNRWLPKTRSIPYWTTSVFVQYFFYCDWFGSDLRIGHFFTFRCPLVNTPQLTLNRTQLLKYLLNSLLTESMNYVPSLYKFGTNGIEITISNSPSIILVPIGCCGNMCYFRSNALFSTSLSVAAETCLAIRCLAMDSLRCFSDCTIPAFRHHVTVYGFAYLAK
jgi:hypothetical protein